MSTEKKRRYEPWGKKHKLPSGFGTLCPENMAIEEAQGLLDSAVPMDDQHGSALWAAKGEWLFVARPTRVEVGIWHGYPVPGAEAGEDKLKALEENGMIDRAQRRRFRKQKTLPEYWE